jgi:hypothetical protein
LIERPSGLGRRDHRLIVATQCPDALTLVFAA